MSRKKKKKKKKAKPKKAKPKRAPSTTSPKKRPRVRRARVRPKKGPLQIALPLQMPLALGTAAFAERPVEAPAALDTSPDDEGSAVDGSARPTGEQTSMFD